MANRSRIEENWVQGEGGYEVTRARKILLLALENLKKERGSITLVQKGYQSGNTMLVDFDDNRLLIDKPRDWPGGITRVRAIFRDNAKLWNHFVANIFQTDKDTLYARFPEEMYLLQRRAHYRVDAPRGSQVTFTYEGQKMKGFFVQDVSSGGMLIFTSMRRNIVLYRNKTIRDIVLNLAIHDSSSQGTGPLLQLQIPEGEVVRGFRNEQLKLIYSGIKFSCTSLEEETLLKYVRQRELALLRKGSQI